jgi:RNA-directed DNA polymerase
LDQELEQCAEDLGCAYSRYADDIAFSGDSLDRGKAVEIIRRSSVILGRYGFSRNRQKTHVATPGSRKIVTGLLVDGEFPRLTSEFRERIEVHLYHARTKGISEHCIRRKFRSLLGFKAHLGGLITYAEHVDPSFGVKCRSQFDSLPWGELLNF